jgi:hypothetical protein
MKHLSEEELVELYYGEASNGACAHRQACRECSARFAELQQSLDAVRPAAAARRGVDYGERVWESLRLQLVAYEKKRAAWRGWTQWKAATLAVGCALLLAAAFVGGRYWERHTAGRGSAAENANSQAAQRVVLVVLTDHLDRAERLLVELQHTESSDEAENAELQSEARELLASNRLYRTTAGNAGDPVLAGALDRLEGVLAEIANNPNLTAADLQRVRHEMNTEGILFEIRVLMAQRTNEGSGPKPAKGASI